MTAEHIPDICQTYDMSFEFGRPRPAAEMRLKCCGTQVLDCKGVYCSAHNAAVPSGIRDSESVGPGQTRIRPGPDTAAATPAGQKRRRLSWHPETAKVVAESAPEASPALSSSLAATGPLSSLSSSPPAPASPSLPALAPSPSSMSPSPPSAAASARAPAVQPVTIPRTNQVEDVHAAC